MSIQENLLTDEKVERFSVSTFISLPTEIY